MGKSAAQPGGGRAYRRLPGLWVICVVFGLAGMWHVAMLFYARAPGLVLFGAIAIVSFGLAAGLWRRWNPARLAAMGLLGISCIPMVVGLLTASEHAVLDGFSLCVTAAMIVYLWLRRRHFKLPASRRPRFRSPSAIVTGGCVLVGGVALILLMVVDEPRQEFPRLVVEEHSAPDDQNGYVALEGLMKRFPNPFGDDIRYLSGGLDRKPPEGAEWTALAGKALEKRKALLEAVDGMLSKPAFVLPKPPDWEMGMHFGPERTYCLELGRLLAFQSRLKLREGRPTDALATAEKLLRLGMRLILDNDGFMTYLTGDGLVQLGSAQVRKVAAAPQADASLLRPLIARLELDDGLRRGFERALGQELAQTVSFIPRLPMPGKYYRVFVRGRFPFLKPNMTRNLLGRCLSKLAASAQKDGAGPLRLKKGPWGIPCEGTRFCLLHFIRNPVGDIIVGEVFSSSKLTWYRRLLARLRLTRLMVAARCYSLEAGRLPDSLDALVPEYFDKLPLDPFSGKPFVYEPRANPPRIRSVGKDSSGESIVAELPLAR